MVLFSITGSHSESPSSISTAVYRIVAGESDFKSAKRAAKKFDTELTKRFLMNSYASKGVFALKTFLAGYRLSINLSISILPVIESDLTELGRFIICYFWY